MLTSVTPDSLSPFNLLSAPILVFDLEPMKIWWANRAGLALCRADTISDLADQPWSEQSKHLEAASIKLKSYLSQCEQGQTVLAHWPLCLGKTDGTQWPCVMSGVHLQIEDRMALLIEVQLNNGQASVKSDADNGQASPTNRANPDDLSIFTSSSLQEHKEIEAGLAKLVVLGQQQHTQLEQQNRQLQEGMLARRHAQEFLQLIMDNIPQAIFWKDRNFRYLGCNTVFLKDAGVGTVEELIGRSDYDMPWTTAQTKWFRDCDSRVMENDTPEYHIIEPQLRADGKLTWLDSNLMPLHDAEGEVVGILGTYEDITERKEVEQAMTRQLAAIEAAIDGIAILDGDTFLYLNQAHMDLLGYDSSEELIGKTWKQFYSAEEIDRFDTEIFPNLEYGHPWQGEATATRKDGSTFPQGISLTLTQDGQLICVCRDITDRKLAQKALEHQIQKEQLLRQITQDILRSADPREIFQATVNRLGQTFQVSRCHIHAYPSGPTPTLPIVAEYLTPGCDSMLGVELPISLHTQEVLSTEHALACSNVYANELLQDSIPETKELEVKSMLAVRTSYQGQANGAIVLQHCGLKLSRTAFLALPQAAQTSLLREWTDAEIDLLEAVADQVGIALAHASLLAKEEQQRQELIDKNEALTQATKAAEQANHTKSVFLASMSHELRTPLNGILGYAQLIQQSPELNADHDKKVTGIREAGEHLLDLIDDLLDLSVIGEQKLELYPANVNFPHFLQHIEDFGHFKAQQKGIECVTEFHPDLPTRLYTDEKRLRQILINVLGDAIKRTAKGRVTITVYPVEPAMDASDTGQDENIEGQHQTIRFQVADTSNSLNLEELPKIYLPSEQVGDISLEHAGVGLGLAIGQKIATLMGGQIQIQNIPGMANLCLLDLNFAVVSSSEGDTSENTESSEIDDEKLENSLARAMMLPSLETLLELSELAKKGLIYDIRNQVQALEASEPRLYYFCEELSSYIDKFQIKQIRTVLQKHITYLSSQAA